MWRTISFALAVLMSGLLHAQVDQVLARRRPIAYQADRCRYEARGRRALCSGQVVVTRDDLRIRCQELEAEIDARGRIVRLACRREVEIVTSDRVARSGEAHFDASSDKLVLDGDARVAQGSSRLAGQSITIDLASGDISVEGRVRGVLGSDVIQPAPR
ncbi:MAG: LptA/OstA family protein [Pseudomonadota bacterium]